MPYTNKITPLWFVVLLTAGFSGILFVGGCYYFQKQKSEIKEEQHKFLSAITMFKVEEISSWLQERKAEGVFLSSSKDFLQMVSALRKTPGNSDIRNQVENWLLPLKNNHEYIGIWVFGSNGNVLASVYDTGRIGTLYDIKPYLTPGKEQGDISKITSDNFSNRKSISNTVSLKRNGELIGYALLIVEPEKMLFPKVANWPVKKETGENLLVSVFGDSVTYEFDHQQQSRLEWLLRNGQDDSLTRSISMAGTLALVEAKDYRGNDILADIKNVPGTLWFVIAKIDQQVVFAQLWKRALYIALFLFIFLLVVIVTGILIWKNQQLHFYKKRYQLQQEGARAEEKIKFMTALLEEVNDAIITFDKDLIIQSWNKGAERIYGWTAGEVVGKYGGGSLRVDFPGASREAIFKELEQTGSWKGEVIHKRKDGSTAYVLSSTSQLRDEKGAILGIMTINKDISAIISSEKSRNAVYRISELALSTRDNDELYSSIHIVIGELMDATNLYIALLESNGQKLSFPYFADEKDTAPPDAQLLGNGLTEYVLKTGKPLLARPEDTESMVRRGIIDLIGEPAIDWLGVPLKIESETIGVIVVQSYNPKIRFGEREKDILLFVSEQIALTIHRRKIQQELIEAKQKAEVSSRLTSSLLANMNHELRTPMNGILGFAEILLDELTDPEARVKASNILVSGRRLMETLDAIMDLSYLESDTKNQQFKVVNIEKIIQSEVANYLSVALDKNIQLYCNLTPGLKVRGSEHLLQHLIKNLLDNAVKYTEIGSVNVESIMANKEGKPYVSVTVKDTGIGISPEYHRLIFDAFRQVSEGYGRQFEGSGLGLTISKKIVDLMNGEISLKSAIGKGSEFNFIIPAVEESSALPAGVENSIPLATIHSNLSGNLPDVLLVEDNTVNLQLLMVYVRAYCNIYTATNAIAAIEMTHERRFDAILMDINLGPGMDGIQAMLEIKKRPDYREVPIVALTGYASIGDSQRLLTAGFADYIAKPYEKDSITELMTNIFKR